MKNLSILIFVLASLQLQAQLDKQYFKTLNSQRVESSDLVSWRQVGPGMAGYCEEFWCHPTDSNVIMMSPDMFNTYGSWDGGKSWHSVKDCDGEGRDLARIRKFEFSRQDPAFGLAISGGGELYQTTDTGHSWTSVRKFKGRFAELTVDPSDDHIWYLGPGEFWNVKANQRHQNGQSREVKNNLIYKSTDKGQSWTPIKVGAYTNLDVGRIIVDPTDSDVLIAATNKGLLRSTDQGESWMVSAKGLPVNRPRDLDFFYDKKNKKLSLYLVEQTSFSANGKTVDVKGGVFRSTDQGKSWSSITGNLAVDMNKISSRVLLGKYWNALASWFQVETKTVKERHPDLPTAVYSIFHRIQVNPTNPDEIYLSHNNKHDDAFLPGGAWKTSDGGKTWIAAARAGNYWLSGKDDAYWKERGNPVGVNTAFAHLQPEMNKREEVWGNRFLEIGIDGRVFICLDQQVLCSDNGGQSWQQMDDDETAVGNGHWVGRGGSNLPGRQLLLETGIKDRYILASGEHGLWQTAPLGSFPDRMAVAVKQLEGQNRHGGAHSIATVAVHPKDPQIIYFLVWRQEHRGKVRRSTDGGKTWENIATIFEADNPGWQGVAFQNSLLIDPEQPDNMYFCSTRNPISEVNGPNAGKLTKGGYGFYRSFDGGYNWELSNNGLPNNSSMRRIAMHPDNPAQFYAALNGENGGLFVSKNKGSLWKQIEVPSVITSVNNIFIDRTTKDLFISCGTHTGTDEGGGVWRSSDAGKTWQQIFDLPYVWQCETSPINPDIITVSAPLAYRAKEQRNRLNPGAYLSLDGGKSWHKVNRNLGQHDRITDIKPDPYREDIIWCAQKGSGWAIGYLKGTTKGWAAQDGPVFKKGEDPGPKGKTWMKVASMSDEFDDGQFDTRKWENTDPGRWLGRVPGLFVKQAVSEKDGYLNLTNDILDAPLDSLGRTYTHTGANVTSVEAGQIGYYFECSMKANKTFMSSTFWLINKSSEGRGCDRRITELDIQECIGQITNTGKGFADKDQTINSNSHSRGLSSACEKEVNFIGKKPEGKQSAYLGGKAYDAFHVYGAWWKSANEVLIFLDGEYVYTLVPPADFDIPMYLRLVTETYNWNPVPADGGMTGSWEDRTTKYDWVRTWKLK